VDENGAAAFVDVAMQEVRGAMECLARDLGFVTCGP